MADTNDSFLGDLGNTALQALMVYFGNKYGSGSGDTPNFYPAPLTPEQKYWDDAKKKQYEAGGSPQSQAVFSAGKQFLEQMPTGPTNHSFLSPLMQGQTYAGGMRLPKIDFSGIKFGAPTPGTPTPIGDPDKNGPHDWGAFGDAKREADPSYDPLNPPSGGGPYGPAPYGLDNLPTVPGVDSATAGKLWSFWQDWKQQNPNWAKLGVKAFVAAATAGFGVAGAVVSQLLRAFVMRDAQTPQNQIPTGRSAADMFRNAPGVAGGLPSARDLAGPQPNKDATYNPATGRWVYNQSMADLSQQAINSQFNHNLQNMVGPQPAGYQSHVTPTTKLGGGRR